MEGSVTLVPGVNVLRTPLLLRAGFSSSSLIRFRDSLVQKYGGWTPYYPYPIAGLPRDLHAWQDLNNNKHLSVGTTAKLIVLTNGQLQDITPQQLISNFPPNMSTTINSPVVTIVDPNTNGPTVDDAVFFNVPVSIGGLILDGLYQITQVTGPSSYEITAPTNATATVSNPTTTGGSTGAGSKILQYPGGTPSWITIGMVAFDLTNPTAIPANTIVQNVSGTTVTLSQNVAAPGVGSGDSIVFNSVPVFTTTNGSNSVKVTFIDNGVVAASGSEAADIVVFAIPTTADGVTITGSYDVNAVLDANDFTITTNTLATAGSTFGMNGGEAQLVYYIAIGPSPGGTGYGLGGYGLGGYGTGSVQGVQTGTEITASDWTTDNWGEILAANPYGGALYYWDPTSGFQNAQVIATAPPFNNGMFISMSEQIMVAYGSSIHQAIGWQKQPLLVSWCDVSNFFQWNAEASDQAGNYTISTGSMIMAGLAAPNQNIIITDLDLWAMNYIGPPNVFGFNKVGAGMGAVSSHSIQAVWGSLYWMNRTNFCSYTSNGASIIPCPIWDQVFQNINSEFLQNVRAMPNTPYNEVGWLYPSAASVSGECDSYVKMNILEPGAPWDYGPANALQRSAWLDQSVLGMPIGAASNGIVYQHETTADAAGNPLVATFTTGYFYLAESEDYVFVDQIIPDFRWETIDGATSAQIQLSFNVLNYPGDTPTVFGPYTCTSATEFLSVRFRGRLMSITMESADIGSFWRLGSCKYRYAPAGRR